MENTEISEVEARNNEARRKACHWILDLKRKDSWSELYFATDPKELFRPCLGILSEDTIRIKHLVSSVPYAYHTVTECQGGLIDQAQVLEYKEIMECLGALAPADLRGKIVHPDLLLEEA